ncbi:hypothetical protein [Lyngbya confervoides]|uniref:Histidine kinase n=1 Tax=Lyngbya confervoides BDU141951 TaxID=1574623 RepID=A0ABD4SZ99_9CYAN|nr:hypothetical protein [Lyngbya confervoides]MCM1981387.1 hypothetical protein [Lyngbya confervoides BDU141951]
MSHLEPIESSSGLTLTFCVWPPAIDIPAIYPKTPMANYLVATFSNLAEAEVAYGSVCDRFPEERQVTLLGAGNQTSDAMKIYDPNQVAQQQMQRMMIWLVPFGFFAGLTFNRITDLTIVEQGGWVINGVLGGLLGAASGLLGAIFIGGGPRLFSADLEAMTLQKRIEQGKVILVFIGTEVQIRQVNRMLRSPGCDLIQVYEGPQPE